MNEIKYNTDDDCGIEESAAKFFNNQNKPLQFHNHQVK